MNTAGANPAPFLPAAHEHRVATPDGWSLSVHAFSPTTPPVACVVLGHAMMVDRRTLCRNDQPTLTSTLLQAGCVVLVVDLRGHGDSGPRAENGGNWSYEDLVSDTGPLLAFAQSLFPELPVFTVGHSLFGHTTLAYMGQQPENPVVAHVAMGVNIWNRRFEPSRLRWIWKRLQVAFGTVMCTCLGRLPARRFGAGTADEPSLYWRTVRDWVRKDRWASFEGVDYHAGLARVDCPVLAVVSEGDRWLGNPDEATLFLAPLGANLEVLRLGARCTHPELQGLTPNHMGLVTDDACLPVWREVARWILAQRA